jgi:hypothetical protein
MTLDLKLPDKVPRIKIIVFHCAREAEYKVKNSKGLMCATLQKLY